MAASARILILLAAGLAIALGNKPNVSDDGIRKVGGSAAGPAPEPSLASQLPSESYLVKCGLDNSGIDEIPIFDVESSKLLAKRAPLLDNRLSKKRVTFQLDYPDKKEVACHDDLPGKKETAIHENRPAVKDAAPSWKLKSDYYRHQLKKWFAHRCSVLLSAMQSAFKTETNSPSKLKFRPIRTSSS